MINSTMQSTKSGGPLAAAWAVTRMIGDEGYLALARRVRDGQRMLVEAVSTEFDHLRVLTAPDASLVALAGDGQVDVFTVCDELLARGWYAQPQLSFGPFPATLHVSISPATEIEEFIDALRGSEKSAAAVGPVRVDPGWRRCSATWMPPRWTTPASTGCWAWPGWPTRAGWCYRSGWPRSTPCWTPLRSLCASSL